MGQLKGNRAFRIAVIAHPLHAGGGISVGRNILNCMQSIEPDNDYLFTIPDIPEYMEISNKKTETRIYHERFGHAGRYFYDEYTLKNLIMSFSPDWIVGLGNRGIQNGPWKQALLCHDPHLFYPVKYYQQETIYNKLLKYFNKRRLARDLKNVQLLMCQTQVAENRLRSTYGYTGETLILPNSFSSFIQDQEKYDIPKNICGLENRFKFFCLTQYYSHKNLECFLSVFSRHTSIFDNAVVILTINENQHAHAGRFLREIKRQNLENYIVNIGPVSQQELAAYYKNCDCLILPTTLESFSGTYIEAMQYNCPIATSDLDFAHEVCGDAAFYFDPWDSESIARAMREVMINEDERNKKVKLGCDRISSHYPGWDENVRRMLEKIQELS